MRPVKWKLPAQDRQKQSGRPRGDFCSARQTPFWNAIGPRKATRQAIWTGISSESRTGPGMLAIRSKLVQRPFFAQDFALTGRQPGDRRAGRLHLAVEQIGRERAAFRRPLDLNELAGSGHHDVEIDLG